MPTSRLRLFASFVSIAITAASFGQTAPLTRVTATSLKMPAEGTTLPYKTAPAFGGAYFDQPVQVVYAPGETTRAFVVERGGRIAVVRDTANPTRDIFLDLTSRIGTATSDHGLLTMAFHPQFAQNGYFYLWFSVYVNGQRANRLARFQVSATDPTVADLASETPLITQLTGPGGHDGGTLLFGTDGYLYLSIGDGDQNLPEINANHQRIDGGFFGGVIRIDVDKKPANLVPNAHASVHAGTYLIPADNPFVGATSFNGLPITSSAVRTEFWAAGLRNPWRMTFDTDGKLWCADVGLSTREEIDHIVRGANYGWEFREGLTAGPRKDAVPAGAQFTDPIWDYGPTSGYSITGGIVYRGTKLSDLAGAYLFSDYVSGRLWALVDNGTRPLAAAQVRQISAETGITGFTLDPRTGDVLLADHDSNVIKRLVANTNTAAIPATLADTGVFSNVATLAPAAGVVAYAPNVSFWSDYAKKSRWFALPDTTSTFSFTAEGAWKLPAGAVWVKHFDLEMRRGDHTSARRVETRVLVKTADGIYGATYQWNAAQTNATLVPEEGLAQTFTITETDGSTRSQRWSFPSRDNCLTCHTEKGGGALTFNTRQMNHVFAFTGGSANEITALAQAGYLSGAPASPAGLAALVDPADTTQSIERRARSYLDANCTQCHQPGGTAFGAWDARASTPLSLAKIINGPLLASGVLPEDRVIVPGSDYYSVLLRHIVGEYAGRMPPIGSNERDLAAETLISAWIADLAVPRPASRLANLAARAQVGTEGDVLIPGFVIAAASKTVLVRAVGPTLGTFSVSGALQAPVLSLFDSAQKNIASNTGWNTAANAAEIRNAALRSGAFALPEGSKDSALLLTLPAGSYTAQTAGANGTTGVALVELYDADATPGTARLINTAVRAQVGVDGNILIPGLVVSEGAAKTVLIRAVGPKLKDFGVTGTLAEPVLSLFAGSESFVTNRGWNNASNATEIRAVSKQVGAFDLVEGSRDSTMLVSLSPGAYTIQVSGANRTTGVALVEVYEVP